ncbi:hypothetical protein PC128_g18272 [Phytophthora cactorum]|nr:hypothetical protein PC128_g18272 [Phytophthora cactorum]
MYMKSSMIIEDYPELKDYIIAGANILHSPIYEAAVVKTNLDGKKDTITNDERALIKRFVTSPPSTGRNEAGGSTRRSYVVRLHERKRQRLEQFDLVNLETAAASDPI